MEWDDFPYPDSLKKDGKFFGEIWMTVAFAPSRGSRWGTEYCETHIEANFGVYKTKKSRKTQKETQVFKGLVPPEFKDLGSLYEDYQIEKLRKWAPVRTYYGLLDEKGEKGNRWRLKLRLVTRHGIEKNTGFEPQKFSLIVTISDPNKKAPVYDEMARIIRSRFKAENLNIKLAAQVGTKQKLRG